MEHNPPSMMANAWPKGFSVGKNVPKTIASCRLANDAKQCFAQKWSYFPNDKVKNRLFATLARGNLGPFATSLSIQWLGIFQHCTKYSQNSDLEQGWQMNCKENVGEYQIHFPKFEALGCPFATLPRGNLDPLPPTLILYSFNFTTWTSKDTIHLPLW